MDIINKFHGVVLSWSRNFPHFTEPTGLLLDSQVFATCPCPGRDQSSPCPTILLLEDPFWCYPSTTPRSSMCFLSLTFNITSNIWWGVHSIKLYVLWSSPVPCCLVPLRPAIFLSTLFSDTLSLCFLLSMWDVVSRPYKTTGNIKVLYIIFLDSKLEDQRFCSEWQHSLT